MGDTRNVIIIGGGPAGCATAIALRNLGVDKITIIESGNYTTTRIGESIPPNTRDLFRRLGIDTPFAQENHSTCSGSHSCWGDNALGYNDFLYNPRGLGWHLQRLKFDRFMAAQAQSTGADLRCKAVLRSAAMTERGRCHEVVFDDCEKMQAEKITARFIVDASGYGAKFARRKGAERLVEDQLTCIGAHLSISADANINQLTLLEATEYGWWYAAKISAQKSIAVLASDHSILQSRNLNKTEHWQKALRQTRYVDTFVGSIDGLSGVQSWIAPSSILSPPAGLDWLAVGDAACAWDPISAQGIYKALEDGLNAATAIAAWLEGKTRSLNEYRETVVERHIHYLQQREYFYHQEQRWAESDFWQRRHAAIM
jgi:flavin-dependent dehydrogenase